MNELETNLRWTCQALLLLNGNGFPSVIRATRILNAGGLCKDAWEDKLLEVSLAIIEGTEHIDIPSLKALRKTVEKEMFSIVNIEQKGYERTKYSD
jgi:hypothetical protein